MWAKICLDYNKGSDARCEPTSFKHACNIIWATIFATIYITVYSIYNIKKQQVRLYKTLYIVQCGIPTYIYNLLENTDLPFNTFRFSYSLWFGFSSPWTMWSTPWTPPPGTCSPPRWRPCVPPGPTSPRWSCPLRSRGATAERPWAQAI